MLVAGSEPDLWLYSVNERSLESILADVDLGEARTGLAFSSNTDHLAICRTMDYLAILDLLSGSVQEYPQIKTGGVDSILYFDNRTLVLTANSQAVVFWDVNTSTEMVRVATDQIPYGLSREFDGKMHFYITSRSKTPTTTRISITNESNVFD